MTDDRVRTFSEKGPVGPPDPPMSYANFAGGIPSKALDALRQPERLSGHPFVRHAFATMDDDSTLCGNCGRPKSAHGRAKDVTTREFCQRCHRVSPVGFHAPDEIWKAVAGRHWEHSILCILCFAQLGDEKHVVWENGIEFYPVSYATHHAARQS